jgi:threonine synthase
VSVSHLQCTKCHTSYALEEGYACGKCGGIIDVWYDYGGSRDQSLRELRLEPSPSIWKYASLLPLVDPGNAVTLYEGGTPLISCNNLSASWDIPNLFVKDESRNPSGAFKDRAIAAAISKARELGHTTVVTASSGNAAASLAAYAAKARMKSYIFIPEHTPAEKVRQAFTHGCRLIKVRGHYSNAYAVARKAAASYHWMNITTTFLNPYALEGDKTIAYELYSQLESSVPDWIVVPTGAGPLLAGIHKGFRELGKLGLTASAPPKMVAVQAEGCAPIVRAFESGSDHVSAWESPETIASAIADPLAGYERDGDRVLQIVRETGGIAVSVSEEEIIASIIALAEQEGVYAEPAGAAPLAAVRKCRDQGRLEKQDRVVCVVTGHGLKDSRSYGGRMDIPIIEPTDEALERIIA